MDSLEAKAVGQWTTESSEETRLAGREFASDRTIGECFGLVGPLGAGKTTFVKGLVGSLGGDPSSVRSPTYALVQQYPEAEPTVTHADLYRTEGPDQQETLGLVEYFDHSLTVVEWAERWTLGWPDNTSTLLFSHESQTVRHVYLLEESPDEIDESQIEELFPPEGILD